MNSDDRWPWADLATAVACIAMVILVFWVLWSVSE